MPHVKGPCVLVGAKAKFKRKAAMARAKNQTFTGTDFHSSHAITHDPNFRLTITRCRNPYCNGHIYDGDMTVFGSKKLPTHTVLGLMHEGCSDNVR